MNRIKTPFIVTESSDQDHKSYYPKSSNMEKFISLEDLEDISIYELKIIMLFHIEKGRKMKETDAEDNQIFSLSISQYKTIFRNPNSYYEAINSLIKRDIISKVEGKRSLYRMNPRFINNLTHKQSVNLGIKNDYKI